MTYSAHHKETTVCVCKSPLKTWCKSHQEGDGMLLYLGISWDACPMTNKAQKCAVSCPDSVLWEQKLSGHFGSLPEQKINVLHSVYPPAHSLPKEAKRSLKLSFCKQLPTSSSSIFPWTRVKTWGWWKGWARGANGRGGDREEEEGEGEGELAGEKGGSQFRAGFHMEDCANFF